MAVRKGRQDGSSSRSKRERAATRSLQDVVTRLRLFMDNVRDHAIIILDPQGQVVDWNAGAKRILGYDAKDIRGKSFAEFFTPDDVKNDEPQRALSTAAEEGSAFQRRWQVRRDGRRIWSANSITALRDEAGVLQGFANVMHDLTERLDQSERKELEEMLWEQNRRKDEFLAVLAHELRNPLAPILNGLELMRIIGLSDPTLESARNIMERQTRYLARLVDDLLDISRITRGAVQLHKQPVALATIVHRAAETTRPVLEERCHELTILLPPEPMQLNADPIRLEQVLVNLLNNAANYTEPGGRISVTAKRAGDFVELSVQDTGMGIEPELLPHVFETFHRANHAVKGLQGGLGIGLSLVRSFVELHEGTVEATSDGRGQGSEFVIRLPLPL